VTKAHLVWVPISRKNRARCVLRNDGVRFAGQFLRCYLIEGQKRRPQRAMGLLARHSIERLIVHSALFLSVSSAARIQGHSMGQWNV